MSRVAAFFLTLLMLWPSLATAQGRPTIVWLPDVGESATVERDVVERVFVEALEGAQDARHVVGLTGFTALLDEGSVPLPECLEGLEPCEDPQAILLSTIGATLVVRTVSHSDGDTIDVTVADPQGRQAAEFTVEGEDLRAAVFAAVAEMTGSTATLSVTSEPNGAVVFVDDEEVGTTPLVQTLTIGTYDIRVESDGFFPFETRTELRAGTTRTVDARLARRDGTLMIRCGQLDALVYVDGDQESPFPINERFNIEPGAHTLEVAAEGFDSVFTDLEVGVGEEWETRVFLQESQASINARQLRRIRRWPVLLQSGLSFAPAATDGSGFSGTLDGEDLTLQCVADAAGCGPRAQYSVFGLEGDAIYTWSYFEIGVLGLAYRLATVGSNSRTYALEETGEFVTVGRGHEWVVRFPQLGGRYLIDHRFEPYARTGLAMSFERFRVEEAGGGASESFRRSSLLYDFHAGLRFHLNALVYAYGQVDISANLSNDAAARTGLMLGLGMNLPDVIGLNSRLDDRFGAEEDQQ